MSDINPNHTSVLYKQQCLMLNASWLPIGVLTVEKALTALMGEHDYHHVLALDMTLDEYGNILWANPVQWDAWRALDVRDGDDYVQAAHARIRVPTILITKAFNKMPMCKPKVSGKAIYERDGGIDQYTGKPVSRAHASLDHVIPKSRGGRDVFTNLVLCDRALNSHKSNKTPEEAGMKLIRQPKEPNAVPVSVTIREAGHPDWMPFLIK